MLSETDAFVYCVYNSISLCFYLFSIFHSISSIVLEYRPTGLYFIFSIQLQSDSQLR